MKDKKAQTVIKVVKYLKKTFLYNYAMKSKTQAQIMFLDKKDNFSIQMGIWLLTVDAE